MRYSIEIGTRTVHLTAEGVIQFEEFRQIIAAILADPAFAPGLHILYDRRSAPAVPSLGFVQDVVDLLKSQAPRFGRTRLAAVVSHVATYGMMRMTSSRLDGSGITMEVFTDPAEARHWLANQDDESPPGSQQ